MSDQSPNKKLFMSLLTSLSDDDKKNILALWLAHIVCTAKTEQMGENVLERMLIPFLGQINEICFIDVDAIIDRFEDIRDMYKRTMSSLVGMLDYLSYGGSYSVLLETSLTTEEQTNFINTITSYWYNQTNKGESNDW